MNSEEILKKMTLRQKADLVCGLDFWHSAPVESLGIPSLVFSDGPNGLRYQAHKSDRLGLHESAKATCFPTSSALANSWDPKLAMQVGRAMGKEAAAMDVDVLLGPGLNMIRNPRGGRNFEYYSEDPYLSGKMAGAMTEGIQKHVSACPKHFLMNSQETNRMAVDERADEKTLHELYLPAFEMTVRQGNPDWIMTAYNKINGIYANENPEVYSLLNEIGFHGAVVSDWGGGNDIVAAIKAGSSLEMPATFGASQKEILEAIDKGFLDEKDLDKRVLEVLEAVDKAMKNRERNQVFLQEKPVSYPHHHLLAVKAAANSAVLLENDGILPLQDQSIAWIGPFDDYPIQGGGSSRVEPYVQNSFITLLQKCRLNTKGIAKGYKLNSLRPDHRLERQALELAQKSDAIVFLAAFSEQEQLEGMDRKLTSIPPNQVSLYTKLLDLGKPVVLVDAIAGPVEIERAKRFAAILYTGLSGQGSMEALLEILCGKVNPSGRLAQTFARQWKDHPSSLDFPATNVSWHKEGMKTGYRAFHEKDVLYPFGYGLSYSTFTYSHFHLSEAGAACKATNVSDIRGSDVLQLYVQFPNQDYKRLKGFKKVELEPGETKEIFIPFDSYTFRSWLPRQKKYGIIQGDYRIELALNDRQTLHTWMVYKKGYAHEIQPALHLYHEDKDHLHMESTLKEFASSPSKPISLLAKGLVHLRDRSLELRKPNMLAISLADMPLKGMAKISGQFITPKMSEAFLEEAKNPSLKNKLNLIRSIKK